MRILLTKTTMTDESITTRGLILQLIPKRSLKVYFIYINYYYIQIMNYFKMSNLL